MSDTNQEPTMEEILASIRRIISEDDAPAGEASAEADTASAPAPAATADDEVLDLTDRVEEAPAPAVSESIGDIDAFQREPEATDFSPAPQVEEEAQPVAARPEPESAYEAPQREPEPAYEAPRARDDNDGLVSAASAGAAAAAFGQLSQSLMMPKTGRSLEDLVQELLKPILKDWLDENLPAIVERKVEEEVERIARRVR